MQLTLYFYWTTWGELASDPQRYPGPSLEPVTVTSHGKRDFADVTKDVDNYLGLYAITKVLKGGRVRYDNKREGIQLWKQRSELFMWAAPRIGRNKDSLLGSPEALLIP